MAVVAKNPAISNDGKLTIRMGALSLVLSYDFGDLKLSGLSASNTVRGRMMETLDFFSRNRMFSSRYTKDKVIEGSCTVYLVGLTGEIADPTVYDVVMLTKDWSAAASSTTLPTGAGDVPHAQFEWQLERTDLGATNDKLMIMKYVEFSLDINESGDGDTLTLTFKAKPYSTDSYSVTG